MDPSHYLIVASLKNYIILVFTNNLQILCNGTTDFKRKLTYTDVKKRTNKYYFLDTLPTKEETYTEPSDLQVGI